MSKQRRIEEYQREKLQEQQAAEKAAEMGRAMIGRIPRKIARYLEDSAAPPKEKQANSRTTTAS